MHRKKTVEPPGEFLTKTRQLLINRPAWLTLNLIESEIDLPYAWLLHLHNNPDCRPAVHRVERLHNYLIERIAQGVDPCTLPN